MAESVAVLCEGLSKRYSIGVARDSPRTLIETFSQALRNPRSFFSRNSRRSGLGKDFWALRDVSFEVREGRAFGIIGRNGSGKSTLLKILSRLTEPTLGEARICGRSASLLEIGTGFHPELTGRENVFLSGAVLGMPTAEIRRKFDQIVEFSGVEQFIDTAVKKYSSGMYVRLAFSVSAHLDPDILIVDEVLAVGDAEFQEKCINKMSSVTKEGRTVIFVSHSLESVSQICSGGIVLEKGKIIFRSEGSNDFVSEYRAYLQQANE